MQQLQKSSRNCPESSSRTYVASNDKPFSLPGTHTHTYVQMSQCHTSHHRAQQSSTSPHCLYVHTVRTYIHTYIHTYVCTYVNTALQLEYVHCGVPHRSIRALCSYLSVPTHDGPELCQRHGQQSGTQEGRTQGLHQIW